jgi:hypothetical protein
MARISDLAKIEQPAENSVFPVSDGSITKKVTLADLKNAIVKQASTTVIGAVKVGSGLTISDTGVLSVRNFSGYTLPPASAETLGGVRIGAGLTLSETSVLSVDYVLPTATSIQLGGVKIGAGIAITNGVISVDTSNIAGGSLGDIPYQLTTSQTTLLPGNITTVKKVLAQTGTGTTSRAPIWSTLSASDIGLGNISNESKEVMFSNPTFTGTVTTTAITTGSSSIRGDITGDWHITGQFRATFADLAEKYLADTDYAPGTVVVFGGSAEITLTEKFADTRVAGVISTNPAYVMNEESTGLVVALRGKVPVKVVGKVNKGDLLVTSSVPGFAQVALANFSANAVFAKSLESKESDGAGTVIAVVL